jgi:hypothetical protein
MKEIYNIPINDVDYAVGLEWEEIVISKTTNINNEIKSVAKRKNRDNGCKISTDNKIQIGLARQNTKNMPVAACFVSKVLKDTLFVMKVNNLDNWICYVNSEGLIVDGKEGIFGREQLIDILDELGVLGTLKIACSEEDRIDLFSDDNIDYDFKIISIEEILAENKKTQDDVVTLLVKEGSLIRNLVYGMVIAGVAGAGYYLFFQEDQLYLDIIDQQLSVPLTAKEEAFKKVYADNQAKIASAIYENSGKFILREKVESNIYTKQEIFEHLKELYETYPLYFYEWEFDSIQFSKSDDNKDIKFSVIYKRIENSVGFYSEIKDKALELAKSKFQLYNVNAYPGDLDNNIIIIDHYFKKPAVLKDNESEMDIMNKLEKEKKKADKSLEDIKTRISETEYRVSSEIGFISKKFTSAVQDAADEIDGDVASGIKIYDKLIKSYKNSGQEEIDVPASYYSGNKNDFVNMTQRNSFYLWRDEKQPKLIPPAPTDRDKLVNYKAFAKSWDFTVNSSNYSTQGVGSIERAVDLLDRTDISIYTVNYKLDNETWYIKGELYEKN